MEIKTLKENIGVLLLNDLESLGVNVDSKDVKLYTTTDDYCNEKLESTWVASVNAKQRQLMFIANGILYDEETAHTLNKEAEVARIFVDEPKAEMLIDALFHAYPELICRKIEELDEEEFLFEHQIEIDDENEDGDKEVSEIDIQIGKLRAKIASLKNLKKDLAHDEQPDGDACIDLYKRVKKYAGDYKGEQAKKVTVIKRKNSSLFISRFNKIIKLIQIDIKSIVKEGSAQLPISEISRTILLDKKTIKSLLGGTKK